MKRQEALDRIEARRGFFVHLSVYVAVSVGLGITEEMIELEIRKEGGP